MFIQRLDEYNPSIVGIVKDFVTQVTQVLDKLNDKATHEIDGIHNPIISVIEVSPAAQILHEARIKDGYSIIR